MNDFLQSENLHNEHKLYKLYKMYKNLLCPPLRWPAFNKSFNINKVIKALTNFKIIRAVPINM